MRSRLLLSSLLLLVAVSGRCAKRMPPPSPDRFPPRLELLRTRGLNGVELQFDEPVDLLGIDADSIAIVAPDDSRLQIRGLTASSGSSQLLVWTARQSEVLYRLTATVPDLAGNKARIQTRFRGGSRPDTVAPRVRSVRPRPGQTRWLADEVVLEFSKPMDTLVAPQVVAVPRHFDSLLTPAWDASWQRLTLRLPGRSPVDLSQVSEDRPGDEGSSDTLAMDQRPPVHLVILPGMADLEGNRILHPVSFDFTSDSVFPGPGIAGRVIGPVPALVYLLTDTAVAVVATDGNGDFTLRPAEASYEVIAVSDTNQDGLADFVGRLSGFVPNRDSLVLRLQPESVPRAVGEYRR